MPHTCRNVNSRRLKKIPMKSAECKHTQKSNVSDDLNSNLGSGMTRFLYRIEMSLFVWITLCHWWSSARNERSLLLNIDPHACATAHTDSNVTTRIISFPFGKARGDVICDILLYFGVTPPYFSTAALARCRQSLRMAQVPYPNPRQLALFLVMEAYVFYVAWTSLMLARSSPESLAIKVK